MRSLIAMFVAGAVAGALILYAFLFSTGRIVRRSPAPATVAATPPPVQPRAQPSAPPPAPQQAPQSIAPSPAPVAIGLPIAGLKPSDLRDSFEETHNGHKHEAIDILAPRGTPVHAVVDGVIQKLFLSKPGGNTIYEFDTSGTYCYYYAHLDRYADGLAEGQTVKQGDVIAYVGSTGNADVNTPHLHFEVHRLNIDRRWWQGEAINPYPWLLQAATLH